MALERMRPATGVAGERSRSIDERGPNRVAAGVARPIAVPLWLGAERPGVEAGAAALDTGLRARWWSRAFPELLARLGTTETLPVVVPPDARDRVDRRDLRFLPAVADACRVLAVTVAETIRAGELALALGGDHALSVGSLTGAAGALPPSERLGVLWLDAHPDLNTPATSPSGHLHGMPLAVALGLGGPELGPLREILPSRGEPVVRAEDVCVLGVRDVDPGERALIREQGIWALTMEEWSDRGIVDGLEAALAHLERQGVAAVHVSLDLDVLDPAVLPGTGTAVPGGLTYREASAVLRRLREWPGPIRSVDWVELNPLLDPSGRSTEVAVALLATLLGEAMR